MYRPTDDQLFMATAEVAASRSLCSRARVGAVIISIDMRVIATGRNGPPQFFPHNEQPCTEWCPRAMQKTSSVLSWDAMKMPIHADLMYENGVLYDHGHPIIPENYHRYGIVESEVPISPNSTYDDCVAIHAEANALLSSDRSLRLGGMMYVTGAVCYSCAKLIANSGISYLVVAWTENVDADAWRGSKSGYNLLQSTQTNVYHLKDKELIPWGSR